MKNDATMRNIIIDSEIQLSHPEGEENKVTPR